MPHMAQGTISNGKVYLAVKKPADQVIDSRYLKMQLEISREENLLEYFKEMNQNTIVPIKPIIPDRAPQEPSPFNFNRANPVIPGGGLNPGLH